MYFDWRGKGDKEGLMKTAITFFTGGGLADIALQAAGFRVVAGLELVEEIAEVANRNLGGHVRVGDILEANPADYPDADLHHYSPPCTRASVANANATESDLDIAFARKIVEFVRVKRPKGFTLENVRGYRKFHAFQIIMDGLRDCGYQASVFVLNSASYGVPQTRIRLIVMASLDSKPVKPLPTHQKHQDKQASLFETRLPRWVGWLESIQDLVPTLPESKFADWQLKRLDAGLLKQMNIEPSFFVGGANKSQSFLDFAVENRPTIPGIRNGSEPMSTIPADHPTTQCGRAFIVDGQETVPSKDGRTASTRNDNEPYLTVSATTYKGMPKAFIIDGKNSRTTTDEPETQRNADEPIFTICALDGSERHRAFIDEVQKSQSSLFAKSHEWLESGRVVSMTPRALARFQSMPDWYELPANNALACRIIGNGFPCLMAQRIFEQF